MPEALALAKQISDIISGTALAVLLVGSYFGVWVWGRTLAEEKSDHAKDVAELRADYEKRLDDEKLAKTKWESLAISATGLATHGVALAEQRTK